MVARHQDILGPVLVVVPCLVIPYLNEEKHIEKVVTRLLAEGDRLHLKIVIADGGSTDRTLEIARRLSKVDRRVVLMDDPKRIAAAVNDAMRKYGDGAQFLIRIDAHASYPDRYCEHLLQVQARTRANSVMVTMHTEGRTCFQRAAAAAQNLMVGSGGAAHRNETGGVAHIIMQAGWSFGLFASLFAEFSGTRGSKSIGEANHEIPTHDRIAR
jgi:succinoglycan biosynthesis protein ExoA